MEYFNNTIAVAIAAVVFVLALIYRNAYEPYSRHRRIQQAEQAQKELLDEQESLSKRGSNKQAKK
ncbi:hypothetical protein BGZ65_011081, partial [Modicella reniformis]